MFVNKDIGACTTAELLSTFCDNIMKTGGDKIEGEVDSLLDKIVMLFSYLSDKVPRAHTGLAGLSCTDFSSERNCCDFRACRICLQNFIASSSRNDCFSIAQQVMMTNVHLLQNLRYKVKF